VTQAEYNNEESNYGEVPLIDLSPLINEDG
jgi:hypothetical protein